MVRNKARGGRALRIAVGIAALVLLLAGGASAATPISACTTINSHGTYVLIQNIITSSSTSDCILITASNVTLDGAGYTINSAITTYYNGIVAYNSTTALNNVTVKNIVVTNWYYGIYYYNTTNGNITNNTVNFNSWYGITLDSSGGNTLTNNKMTGNRYNFVLIGRKDLDFNNNIDTSNIIDNKSIYYRKNEENTSYDSLNNAGTFYCIWCNNVTIKDISFTKNDVGVYFWKTNNSRIENVKSNSNSNGIYLALSSNNTLTSNAVNSDVRGILLDSSDTNTLINNNASSNTWIGIDISYSYNNTLINNTANSNRVAGILTYNSRNNTLTKNTVNSNNHSGFYIEGGSSDIFTTNIANSNSYAGIYFNSFTNLSINNTVYNNYFNNTNNAVFAPTTYSNIWNTTKTSGTNIIGGPYLGGNFWANPSGTGFSQTCADANGDGICDSNYTLASGNIDYLPLTTWNGAGAIQVTVDYPKNNSSFLQGEMIMFSGNVSGGVAPYNYSWTSNIDGLIGNASTIYNSWWEGNRTRIFTFSLSPGTHTITMTVNDSSGLTNSTSINIRVNSSSTNNISGQSATGAMTWNASNFPAFWKDLEQNATSEKLRVISLDVPSRTILSNGLYYNITRGILQYQVYANTGLTINYGLDASGYNVASGGYYAKVGWFGKTYVALKGNAKKFAKLVLEHTATESKTILVGETWDMGDGYTLKLNSIDAHALPRQAWVTLNRSGTLLDDKVAQNGTVYTYVARSMVYESDVPMFVTYFDNISTNSIRLKYTWLVSSNPIILGAADQIGLLEVMTAGDDRVELTNKDTTITLSQGSTITIADGLRFRVNNTPTLDYYPEMTVITGISTGEQNNIYSCTNITSPGTYILTQNIINSTADDACIKITSSDVVFDGAGYTIDGVDTPSNDGIAVHFNESLTNVTVKNVTLTDWDYGIIYKNVSNGKIANITASSNSVGIVLKFSSSNNVRGNTAYNNTKDGILLNLSSSNNITGNTAYNNSFDGMFLKFSSSNNITDNTANLNNNGINIVSSSNNDILRNNTANWNSNAGIVIDSSNNSTANNNIVSRNIHNGIVVWESNYTGVSNNTATSNMNGGIWLVNSTSNTISLNNASYNKDGINFESSHNNVVNNNTVNSNNYNGLYYNSSTGNTITNNLVGNNGKGIATISSSNNTIYNDFFNNTNNVLSNNSTNTWNTTKTPGTNIIGGPYLGGNFWANPNGTGISQTCVDADGDVICDYNYTMAPENIDYLPLATLPWIKGDVDNSGGVPNLLDVIYLLNYVAGTPGYTLTNPVAGDVDSGGGVPNLLDVIYLLNYVAGTPGYAL